MSEHPTSSPQPREPAADKSPTDTPHRGPKMLEELSRPFVMPVIIGVLGILVLVVVVRKSAPSATLPGADATSNGSVTMVNSAIEQERRALAKAKLTTLTHEVGQANKALSDIDGELQLWANNVEPALTSDAGRAVAGDPIAVERFRAVHILSRPDPSDTQARRAALAALVEEPEKALASGTLYIPDENSLAEVQKHRAWAEARLGELRRRRELAEGILRDAAASGLRAPITLREAMVNLENKQTLELAANRASQEDKARQEAAELETQARANQIRELGKESAAGVQTETKEQVSDSRADRFLDTTVGERERLMKLAKDPAIQAKFQPFLARGYANIGNGFKQNYAFPKPAEFRLLQHGHALDNHENFILAGCGQLNMFGHNDRPRWIKPTNDAEMQEMRRRFELFKKLAPIWIELGLLQP
jgi:hypothetical protein